MKPINFSAAPLWRYFDSELSESWCKRKLKDISLLSDNGFPVITEESCDSEKVFLRLKSYLNSQGFQPRKAGSPYSSYEFAVITGSVSTHIDTGYGLVAGALLYATKSKKRDPDSIELVTAHGGLPLRIGDVFVFDANKWHGWISNVTYLLALMTIKKVRGKKLWMDHGYSAAEARQLEKEQIQKLLEQEDIFDALENVGWSPVTACKQ